MSSARKVDLIADIRSPAKDPPVRFQTAAGIQDTVNIAGSKSAESVRNRSSSRRRRIESEIDNAALHGSKEPHRAAARLNLGPEQRVQHPHVGRRNRSTTRCRAGAGRTRDLTEVIARL